MRNHKWKDISSGVNRAPKEERCTKCGIERTWLYGYMQCWEYLDYRLPIGSGRESLNRPSCTPILQKGITEISRKGIYI